MPAASPRPSIPRRAHQQRPAPRLLRSGFRGGVVRGRGGRWRCCGGLRDAACVGRRWRGGRRRGRKGGSGIGRHGGGLDRRRFRGRTRWLVGRAQRGIAGGFALAGIGLLERPLIRVVYVQRVAAHGELEDFRELFVARVHAAIRIAAGQLEILLEPAAARERRALVDRQQHGNAIIGLEARHAILVHPDLHRDRGLDRLRRAAFRRHRAGDVHLAAPEIDDPLRGKDRGFGDLLREGSRRGEHEASSKSQSNGGKSHLLPHEMNHGIVAALARFCNAAWPGMALFPGQSPQLSPNKGVLRE